MVQVQEWAEIRAMKAVEGLSIKEIARRTGHSRNTIRAVLRCAEPPRYGPRAPRPSKLDPFKAQIHELLKADGEIPSQVIREWRERPPGGGLSGYYDRHSGGPIRLSRPPTDHRGMAPACLTCTVHAGRGPCASPSRPKTFQARGHSSKSATTGQWSLSSHGSGSPWSIVRQSTSCAASSRLANK